MNNQYNSITVTNMATSQADETEFTGDNLPNGFRIEAFRAIVHEALNQLYILRKINGWPEPSKSLEEFKYKTFDERYCEEETEPKEKIENDEERHNKSREIYEKHATLMESVLKFLQEELTTHGSFEQFSEIVDGLSRMKADDDELLNKASNKENEFKQLEQTFEKEKMDFCSQIAKHMSAIGKIKDNIEDFTVEEKVKKDYIRKWLNSKMEMNQILCKKNETEREEAIKLLDLNIEREMRVHEEIISAYEEFQKDLGKTLEGWKEKYTTDIEKMLERIRILREDYEGQLFMMKELETLYSRREKQLNDYKDYKIEQVRIKQELERKNHAATKIQAWWRGTMVRKGFGKYRKKKEKKGKKKSSEKNLQKN